MATLKEADFQPVHKDLTVVPVEADAEAKFRTWILSLAPPSVGRKRNHSSVMIKASQFTLDSIEGPTAIMRPPANPEPLVDLADWNYPGNPYFDSRPLRLRAFVLVALDMVMLDKLLDSPDEEAKPNQDHLGAEIGRLAYVYPGLQSLLPAEVRDAYLVGLKKLVRRALDHGPKALSLRTQGMFTWPVSGLALAAPVLNDAGVTKEVEAYARTVFANEEFFRPAGYFVNGGTLDSFNGISTCVAMPAALLGKWPFARDAVARVYCLRAHLTLPEPDGVLVGPSHMAALTSTEPAHDQWDFRERAWAAALISDEAACFARMPDEAEIARGAAATVGEINAQLHELSWAPGGLDPAPWKFQAPGPGSNGAYHYYPAGYYARRIALEQHGEMNRMPVLRQGSFVRTFEDEFLVAKRASHAAIIHTGPIAGAGKSDVAYGFGGGALSAFWTEASGSVLLGRGVGSWSPQYKMSLEAWRSLPSHAILGATADNVVFTSAHIVKPETNVASSGGSYLVTVRGTLPTFRHASDRPLSGVVEYSRKFESTARGLSVTTNISTDGKDTIAELYEALPVFLREASRQAKATPTTIEFQVDGKWTPGTDSFTEKVTAVRLTRFAGAVEVGFDRPRRVKLAPIWNDTYMSHAACRNVLVDLLENGDRPAAIRNPRQLAYHIEAAAK